MNNKNVEIIIKGNRVGEKIANFAKANFEINPNWRCLLWSPECYYAESGTCLRLQIHTISSRPGIVSGHSRQMTVG